jgi:predicted  nucleic acid-binding Zn-ribbon protein
VTEAAPHETRPEDDTRDIPSDVTGDITPFHAKALAALEDAVSGLREANQAKDGEIATLRDVVGGLRDTVAKAEARAERAEAAIAGERTRADVLRDRVVTAEVAQREAEEAAGRARADAQAAQDVAQELRRTDEARKAEGRLRRVLAAWRG